MIPFSSEYLPLARFMIVKSIETKDYGAFFFGQWMYVVSSPIVVAPCLIGQADF